MLTLEAYRETGGVQGALAKRADAIFSALTPEQQEIARRALLRLTQPGEGTEDTRRARAWRARGRPTDERGRRRGAALVAARLLTTATDDEEGRARSRSPTRR